MRPKSEQIGVVYSDPYISIVRDAVLFPDGKPGSYIRLLIGDSPNAGVCMVPKFEEKFILLRHFRHATRRWHTEFPRGFAEKDIIPEMNARKEIREELGCECVSLRFIGDMFADTGLIASSISVFEVELDSIPTGIGDTGYATVVAVTSKEMLGLIADGTINDCISISAFLKYTASDR